MSNHYVYEQLPSEIEVAMMKKARYRKSLKKVSAVLIILLAVCLLLGGCNQESITDFDNPENNFVDDDFDFDADVDIDFDFDYVEYIISPTYGDHKSLFNTVFQIYNDGRMVIFANPHYEELPQKICEMEFFISSNEISDLKKAIAQSQFFDLPEKLSDNISPDGAYYTIGVSKDSVLHTVSGIEPRNKRFTNVSKVIKSFVKEGTYQELWQNAEDYISAFLLADQEDQ